MRKMKRWRRGIILCILLTSLSVTSVAAAPSENELKEQKQKIESEVSDLQMELTELLDKIGEMEAQLISTGEKITQTESDIELAEEKAEEQYEAMKVRIKYMYEDGETDVWAALLTADNFSDFLNKAEYVSNVHSYDREQLEELIETQHQIEDLKETLEKEKRSLEEQQKEYTAEQERVNAELEDKQAEVENYDELIQTAAEEAAKEAEEREKISQASETGVQNVDSSDQKTDDIEKESDNSSTGNNNSAENSSNSSENSSSSGNTSAAQAIVNAAYSQLGVPYVYGGTTPGVGLDCSGLVQYCHSVAGISIPRTSQAQGGSGVAVSDPHPGDIVCYGGHVGIYIGNGKMIHAPQTGDVVKISDVYGSPWYRRCW